MLLLTVLYAAVSLSTSPKKRPPQGLSLTQAMTDDDDHFSVVKPGRTFTFPRDHADHPDFKTEWWYFTGNLEAPSGRPYGYQLTFFRSGLTPPEEPASTSVWKSDDVMMAHLAVSDIEAEQFFSYERFSRRALGLAGVEYEPQQVSVWLEDWKVERSADGLWRLQAAETLPDGRPFRLNLALQETKPPVLHGDSGYSRKGPNPENASYYVSLTRLNTHGRLHLGEIETTVQGLSWFDHEWSSSLLAPGLVGWDWLSLQLDDGWELMLFHVREENGQPNPASSATLVSPQGTATHLSLESFTLHATSHYLSKNGVRYPSAWTVELPSHHLTLHIVPRLADQEMSGGIAYWEGAVSFEGERDGRKVKGTGFVEMTGYDR